ncbi:tetratricopeptide repeat protein [Salinactinospora qingdaonensis]|uniref:Tetratricopeptide repeat protein n=2 Tax=Salinactinospora qingdaonensis TaxID=702744 RepID=A0ABP7FG42_9ACTN
MGRCGRNEVKASHAPTPGERPEQSFHNTIDGDNQGTAVQAGTVHGGVHIHPPAASQPSLAVVPLRQLPPAPPHFVDRHRELAHMAEIVTAAHQQQRSALLVLTGLGGVGKSALATRFLHEHLDRFPDGQLYCDLRGFSRLDPADPADIVQSFLHALGVPPPSIPPDLAGRAAWFRSLTNERRLAILVDNANTAAQVRSLLPGQGAHTVVVTTRVHIGGLALDGAHFINVPPLDESTAVTLLSRIVGEQRVADDRRSAWSLARLCGGLPIAVGAVAVQLATHVSVHLAHTVEELSQRQRLLGASSEQEENEESSVRAVFDLSYDALAEVPAQLYRRLGWYPAADITTDVACALLDRAPHECEQALRALVVASLLHEGQPGRYELHDLLRLHAGEKATDAETPEARHDALGRLLDLYRDSALAADRRLRSYATSGPPSRSEAATPDFPGPDEALTWLTVEHTNLRLLASYAAENGWPEHAMGIADGLWSLYLHRRDATSWLDITRTALELARRRGERRFEGRMLNRMALVLGHIGQYQQAEDVLRQAQQIWEESGAPERLAQTLQRRGLLALAGGHPEEAIDHLDEALRLDETLDQPHNTAITLLGLGRAHERAGRPTSALPPLERALDLLQQRDDPYNEARVRIAYGRALAHSTPHEADRLLEAALATMRRLGSPAGQAEAHEARGDLARAGGAPRQARQEYAAALKLLAETGERAAIRRVEHSLAQLERTPHEAG